MDISFYKKCWTNIKKVREKIDDFIFEFIDGFILGFYNAHPFISWTAILIVISDVVGARYLFYSVSNGGFWSGLYLFPLFVIEMLREFLLSKILMPLWYALGAVGGYLFVVKIIRAIVREELDRDKKNRE